MPPIEQQLSEQELAAQLRKPHGEAGTAVAKAMAALNEEKTCFVYDQMQLQPDSTILEVGFGGGDLLRLMYERQPDIRLYGADYSRDMVALAQQNCAALIDQHNLQLQQANITNLPYADGFFTEICTINTIYFWDDPAAAAQELARVMAPGAKLYIGMTSKRDMQSMDFTDHGFRPYTPDEATSLFADNGFTAIETRSQLDPAIEFMGKLLQVTTEVIIATRN